MSRRTRRERIDKILSKGTRILVIQGTWALKLIEIDDDFEVPCHALDIVTVLEREK